MTLHCLRCEVGWTSFRIDRCWNCGQPGTIGFTPARCLPTEQQRTITMAFGRAEPHGVLW